MVETDEMPAPLKLIPRAESEGPSEQQIAVVDSVGRLQEKVSGDRPADGVAWILLLEDGGIGTSFTGDLADLVSAIELLKDRVMRAWLHD